MKVDGGRMGVGVWALWAGLVCGCGPASDSPLPPLPVQQQRAYGEAVTGRFVSLVDFEDSGLTGVPGHQQVQQFRIVPAGAGELKYVVNITRTGVGAMEVTLPAGASLLWKLPELHDFSPYTLLMVAIYSRQIRDDLKVLLMTDKAGWESRPVLLKPGWNEVLIDLQRLKRMGDFDARGVRSVRFGFGASGAAGPAGGAVRFNIDDIMLIDNRREIKPAPAGLRLLKAGLDYELHLPHRSAPLRIRQGHDGLWRLGPDQALLELQAAGQARPAGTPVVEDLSAFGGRRVGEVAVLEANAVRLRLANRWYFPTSAGQWASLAVRQIRWEYTFYADGRVVTDLVVNNAGGRDLSALRIRAPGPAAWSDGYKGRLRQVRPFEGPVGRWSFLLAPASPRRDIYESNYAKPARLVVRMGLQEASDGDVEADGFDESQGCYHLRAKEGHCRFLLLPGGVGLADAVVRVAGPWSPPVVASVEGLAVRQVVLTPAGEALFVVPGLLSRPSWVELIGPAGR